MDKRIPRIIVEAVVICVVMTAVALAANSVRKEGIDLVRNPQAPQTSGAKNVDLAAAKKLFDTPGVTFIDTRDKDEFEAGHIQGAINIPYHDAETLVSEKLENADPDAPIVTYCSGENCNSSTVVAMQLVDDGFSHVSIFFGGWPEWKKAKYPVSESKDQPLYNFE